MKLFVSIMVFLQFILMGTSNRNEDEMLKIEFFYESLCPYSKDFFVNELYPGYQKLRSSLIVDLVPYGNAKQQKVNGTWQFDCQHGFEECELNKLQACGISRLPSQDDRMEFAKCVMELGDVDESHECSERVELDQTDLLECVNGVEGDKLLARHGYRTREIHHPYVPWLTFNGKQNKQVTRRARVDFVQTACYLLRQKPRECYNHASIG